VPRVQFTNHLKTLFPSLEETDVPGNTVAEIVRELDAQFPRIAEYLLDERGALRKHVNVFVGDRLILDRATLSDIVAPGQTVFVLQALSGG
jgi:molybdopterin synthase sulfur carrier subunit